MVLVVTVIVLLILSGVTISMITGGNGIINRTIQAAEQTEIAQAVEELQMLYLEDVMNDINENNTTEEQISSYLDYLEENDIPTKEEDGSYYAEVEGRIYEIEIDEDGNINIEYVEDGEITEPRITSVTVTDQTASTVEIEVEAIRMEGGTYYYYIGTDPDDLEEAGSDTEGVYEFEGLKSGTYYIKVVAESAEGLTAEKTITVDMEEIPAATNDNMEYTITWADGKATVVVTTTTSYDIETSTDNSKYNTTAKVTGLNNGDVVYARLTDGITSGTEMEIPITDDEDPVITEAKITETTTRAITIYVEATDAKSGIAKYKYYIAESEAELETVAAYKIDTTSNTTGEITIDELTQGTEYWIKVVVVDGAGNEKTSETLNTTTSTIPAAETNITRTVKWNSSDDPDSATATVTLETTTSFDILYSTDGIDWYDYNDTPQTVTNGDSIWMCLTDGYQNGTSYELEVSDTKEPDVGAITTSTTKSIAVTTTATDEGSGVNENSYTYYIADSQDGLNTASGTPDTGTHTFSNLTQNSTYWIKIEVEDIIGNKTEYITTAGTEKIPAAETAVERTVTWNESTDPNTATATVELSTTYDFGILYSTNNGASWESYSGTALSVTNGDSIWICLTDEYQNGEEYVLSVTDFTGPTVTINEESKTASTIEVSVDTTDTGAGMSDNATYSYYIKLASAADSEYVPIETGTISKTCKFTGLTAQTDYTIKVTTTDKIGNAGEGTYSFTTSEFTYLSGNISFSDVKWSDKKASVDITNNTSYTMEYKVFESSASADLTDNTGWEEAATNPVSLTGLVTGNYIVARLTDGTNTTTGYASLTITDTTDPEIKVLVTVGNGSEVKDVNYKEWDTTTYVNEDVTLTIEATDEESGLQDTAYTFNGTEWQSGNTATYTENTAGIVIKVRDEAGNITSYDTINITNIDKTGPGISLGTSSTKNSITVTVTATDTGGVGVDEDSYTYYIAEDYDDLDSAKEETDGDEHTFTGLTPETSYWIKVVVKDKLGNESTKYEQVTTGALDVDLSKLTISDPVWDSKSATVTITNELYGSYYMQYQVVTSGNEFDKTTGWSSNISDETKEVNGLKNGDKVYAWLVDEDGYTSSTVIKTITDTTAPTVAVLVTVGDGSEVKDVDYKSWDSTTYVNEDVTLTIEATDTESGLQDTAYTFNGTDWQEGNTATYSVNTSGIVIKVRDEAGNIKDYGTIDIKNIDKTGPNIILSISDTTTNQTTVTVTASDDDAGMANTTYTYSIKEGTSGTYTTVSTNNESNVYTFEKLTAGATYYIKVETQDALGNTNSEEISVDITSLTYYTGDITFTNAIWSNGIATVTGTATTTNAKTYTMQYQIGRDGASIDLTASKWTDVSGTSIDIGTLEDEDVVYARLTDGYNVTVNYAQCTIINPAEESYTEEELASNTTRSDYDILGISVSSTELWVQIDEEQTDASLYTYYYKTINDDEYKLISTCTYADDPAVITGITENATYKIKVLVIDSSGTVTRCENTATMIAAEQITAGDTADDTDNRTYIDNSKTIEVRTTAGTGSAGDGTTTTTSAGYTISVPATFSISSVEGEKEQSEGVVLTDSSSNEYVWIPVNDAIYDGVTSMPVSSGTASRTYKPMAIEQSENKYQSIIYTFNGTNSYRNTETVGIGTTGYREPDIVTGSSLYDASESNYSTALGFSSSDEFSEYMQSSYDNMVTAVDTFGGFYVGRYETTTDGGTVVGSKANTSILSTTNWYYMYLYQDSTKYASNPYYSTVSVTSSMIWGSQWDTMLNWLLTGTDKTKVATKTGSQPNAQVESGTDPTDIMGNIYDLGSNAYEWTQEANSTNYRVYRGGSYNSTTSSTAMTRGYVVPTDLGPVFGTRMALYVQSTSDVTGPSVKIKEKTSTSNTITVTATATDKETGVSSYEYWIGTEEGSYTKVGESTSGTYTYSGLKQSTTYYIKVVAIDGKSNEGYATDSMGTTELGEVANTAIELTQLYGSDESGIAQLTLDDTYSESGYYIQYVLVAETDIGTFSMDTVTNWTTYDSMITELSNGVYICASIYDGTNRSSDYFSEQVSGLEEYAYIDANGGTYATKALAEAEETKGTKTTLSYTIEYSDGTDTATIPAGFKVGITSTVNVINNGLVIQDEAGNQYVWVPVETAIESSTETSKTSSEKAMARYQSGYSSSTSPAYYEGILYDFSGTTSTKKTTSAVVGVSGTYYREPSLITRGADYTWNIGTNKAVGTSYDVLDTYYKYMNFGTTSKVDAFDSYTEFGQYMNQEYTNMINSVDKYGGFYVGRFETSISANSTTGVAKSQISQTLTTNINWWKWYYFQDSNLNTYNPNYSSTSVTSSMIWGSQWDAMLNWMLEDSTTSSFVTSVTGNRTGEIAKTGSYSTDIAKNIFDLSGNTNEFTQEKYSMYYVTRRGGTYLTSSASVGTYNTSTRYTREPTESYTSYTVGTASYNAYSVTSRMALYINNTEDGTAPSVGDLTTSEGTNNIEVSVTASDEESGISKYIYSISYLDFESGTFDESTDILKTETTYGSTHVFSGLYQGQIYYVRIEVVNGAGLTTTVYTGELQTIKLEVDENAIVLDKTWGKDGSGTQYYVISEGTTYEDEGYSIQYQVVQSAAAFKETDDSAWTTGDTVTGLNVGDIVYVRLYDEVNYNEGEYFYTTITELETYTEPYTSTEEYSDGTNTAWIPEGFKRGSSSLNKTISNGLVIEDEYGNQYVWIPVSQAVETSADASTTSAVKAMARYQSGSTTYYEGISYTFSGTTSYKQTTANRLGTSNYREPSLVTGSTANYSWVYEAGGDYDASSTYYGTLSELKITSATSFGEYMNDQYTAMITSVEKYGGFYVGRYETTLYTTSGSYSTSGTVVKSIAGATPMASVNWYKMYLVQDSNYSVNPYYGSTAVVSSMIWGSQWDAMLNYILTGTDAEDVTAVTGNHTGTRAVTASFGNDLMNNIFDLSSNVLDWTQEAYSYLSRVFRGGYYNVTNTHPASYRSNTGPTYSNSAYGSRLSLYLQ